MATLSAPAQAEPLRCLVVAAEPREFAGILKRAGPARRISRGGARYARQIEWRAGRWWLVANGPGPRLVEQALAGDWRVDAVLSVGFCGALDPDLRIGDIVVSGDVPRRASGPFVRGEILSIDRVAVTAEQKRRLRAESGAAAVEMESAAVAAKARQWGVPFGCVRVVSDTAGEDLPLDFNEYRAASGRLELARIAGAALLRPFTALPGLLRLERNCRLAAERLGEFLANCEY
jgi:adenosylhomocysteine nucleosidase